MLAVSHQPTMYVANTQQPYYYVQAQQSSVPAGQWTTQLVPVGHSGSGYVYSASPTYRPTNTATAVYPVQQQTGQYGTYAVSVPTGKGTYQTSVYTQPQQHQQHQQLMSSGSGQVSYQNAIPVSDANDFTPASPVMSESTTTSDDSSGSFSSVNSSRYNLPSSALNHYTAPSRPRRRSFVQHPRQLDPYGMPAVGQSSLSLPPPQMAQPMYSQPSQQLSHPSMPSRQHSSDGQPAFVRNTGRSGHPVSYQPDQHQQVYSSFELYKPATQRSSSQNQVRPTLHRRASSTNVVATGPPLTGSSYGSGLGMSAGGASGFGMGFGAQESREKKWWRLGR